MEEVKEILEEENLEAYRKIEKDIEEVKEIHEHAAALIFRQSETLEIANDHIESSIIATEEAQTNLRSVEDKSNSNRTKKIFVAFSLFGATFLTIGGALISYTLREKREPE